jgi:formamidopyrimidine-DNA glycosylase
MPELPEVETIRKELASSILGREIRRVVVNHPLVIREPSPRQFCRELAGSRITNILRKGKILVLELADGKALIIHLRMTGQLVYPGNRQKSRVSFVFDDGTILDFNDQRLFGELRVVDNWQAVRFIRNLGPEPFEIDAELFQGMLSAMKTKIKPLLLDQGFISGVGNLYAAEALFRAGIHPSRPAESLSRQETSLLLRQLKDTLKRAIQHKGSSIDNYVRVSGSRGDYVRFHKVYGRKGAPCVKCRTPITRSVIGGRGTFYCGKCQV